MARKTKNNRQRRAAIRDGYRFGLPQMTKAEYQSYLYSDWWQVKRLQKLQSVKYTCEGCGRDDESLQIHHLHYCSLGKERNSDLMALCESCHRKKHPGW